MAKGSLKAWKKRRVGLGWVKWKPKLHGTHCPLCLKEFIPGSKNKNAVWDHCHKCEESGQSFRGFICDLCNTAEPHRHRKVAGRGIQHLIRDPEWQKRLQEYLSKHKCPPLSQKGAPEGQFIALGRST